MTEHDAFNCHEPGCEDHYTGPQPVIQDASEEINLAPPSPELQALVSEALDGIYGRSFSERRPELGKMFRCQGCRLRHRGTPCEIKYKYLHTIEDLETGEKTDIFATVPLPEQIERGLQAQPPKRQFPKAIMGAAAFKARRKHPHLNQYKQIFIALVRELFEGDSDENSEGYKARITKARRLAFVKMRKHSRKLRRLRNRQTDLSRRINRGLVA